MRLSTLFLLTLIWPFQVTAADLVFGLGYSDFNEPNATNGAIVELEVHSRPRWHFAGADWSVAGAIVAHDKGDLFVGVGPAAQWPLRNRWFIEASVMPGYFNASDRANSLGSHFEVRSLLGIGRQVSDTLSVSLAVTHKSNAGTADRNPGVNAVTLRFRRAY